MMNPCIICYREATSSNTSSSSGDVKRLLYLLKRYLDDGNDEKATEPLLEQVLKAGMRTCNDCSKIAKSFCELFHQMKSIELLLNWKVWTLKNIMFCAQRVPSRMNEFRKRMMNQLGTKGVVNADEIVNLKRDLIKKCEQKLRTTFPRIKIQNCSTGIRFAELINDSSTSSSETGKGIIRRAITGQEIEISATRVEGVSTAPNCINPSPEEPEEPKIMSKLRTAHRCSKCNKTFATERRLEEHILSHEDGHGYQNEDEDAQVIESHSKNGGSRHFNDDGDGDRKSITKSCNQNSQFEPNQGKKKPRSRFNPTTGRHRCTLCPKEFKAKSSIYPHYYDAHVNNGSYKCPKCHKKFRLLGSLNAHLRMIHLEKETLKMVKSDKKIKINKTNRNRTSVLDPITGKRKCILCSKEFATLWSCSVHYRNVHLKIRYECRKCRKVYTMKHRFDEHMQTVHYGRRFGCSLCPVSFNSSFKKYQHMKLTHRPGNINKGSSDSTSSFPIPAGIVVKLEKGQPGEDSVNPMTEEANSTSSSAAIDIGEVKLFRASASSANFYNNGGGGTGLEKCTICSKTFSNHRNLKRHHKTVHLNVRYKCKQCNKAFQRQDGLTRHMQTCTL